MSKEKTEEQIKKSKERALFWTKFSVWALFACIIPVGFIGWRYELFKKVGELQLSGWGLVALLIIAVFLFVIIKYVKAGFVEWSMTKQIINGVCKVVFPLGTLLALCISLRNSLDIFIQALSCVLMSEVVAIPLNPFPKWVWDKSKGRFENAVDFVAEKFYNKDKKGE